ncbi:MAG: hypothetical protein ACMXYK_01345 [Candidatus Woesearchaeota archaeon]
MAKAQVTEQFNWLFALIAGGFILLFFLFVGIQLKSASDARIAATVLQNFDAILTGSAANPNTLTTLDVPRSLRFDITCDFDRTSELIIPNARTRIDVSNKLVFTPKELRGNQLFAYVLPIKMPFYIGNAVLMTDSSTIFYAYNPQERPQIHTIFDGIPDGIPKRMSPIFEQDILRAYDKVIFIIHEDDYSTLPDLNRNVRFIEDRGNIFEVSSSGYILVAEESAVQSGTNQLNLNLFSDNFVSDLLIFTLFSKNMEYFECTMAKIQDKAQFVGQIYEKRTAMLYDSVDSVACKDRYQAAQPLFREVARGTSTGLTLNNLENINNQLLLRSCPLIY